MKITKEKIRELALKAIVEALTPDQIERKKYLEKAIKNSWAVQMDAEDYRLMDIPDDENPLIDKRTPEEKALDSDKQMVARAQQQARSRISQKKWAKEKQAAADAMTRRVMAQEPEDAPFHKISEPTWNMTKENIENLVTEAITNLTEGSGEMLGWMGRDPQTGDRIAKSTGPKEAKAMLLEAMRVFYDDNERDGIVTALKNADQFHSARAAAQIRFDIEKLLKLIRES